MPSTAAWLKVLNNAGRNALFPNIPVLNCYKQYTDQEFWEMFPVNLCLTDPATLSSKRSSLRFPNRAILAGDLFWLGWPFILN